VSAALAELPDPEAAIKRALRPSAAHRWLECAAAPAREAFLPEEGDKRYADYGTVGHQVAASAWLQARAPADYLGQLVDADSGPVRVDRDMVEAIDAYHAYVRDIVGADAARVDIERPVDLSAWLPNHGTADLVAVTLDTLHVFDLKLGRGVKVYACANPQLMAYGLGVYSDLETLGLVEDSVRVVLHIAQPRVGHFDAWETTPAALLAFGEDLRQAAARALAPEPPATAGRHCKFCKARAHCATLAAYTAEAVGLEFDDVSRAPVAAPPREPPHPDTDPAQLARMLAAVDVVRDWANAVEAAALTAALAGVALPGWKVVAGRSTRKWLDPEEVIAQARKRRLPIDDFYPRDLASPAQLEKALGREKFSKLGFPALLDKTEGRPTLAAANDKRPALAISAVADKFDDVTHDPLS
jgi:hypothetical protein